MRLHSVFVCCPPMLSRFVDLRARSLYARIKMNPLRAYVSVQIIIHTNRSLIINRNVYILLFPASSRSRPRRNLSLFLMTSKFFHLLVFFFFFLLSINEPIYIIIAILYVYVYVCTTYTRWSSHPRVPRRLSTECVLTLLREMKERALSRWPVPFRRQRVTIMYCNEIPRAHKQRRLYAFIALTRRRIIIYTESNV